MTAFVFRFVSLCYSGTVWIAIMFQCTQICVFLSLCVCLFLGQPFPCVGFDILSGSENTFSSRMHIRSILCMN